MWGWQGDNSTTSFVVADAVNSSLDDREEKCKGTEEILFTDGIHDSSSWTKTNEVWYMPIPLGKKKKERWAGTTERHFVGSFPDRSHYGLLYGWRHGRILLTERFTCMIASCEKGMEAQHPQLNKPWQAIFWPYFALFSFDISCTIYKKTGHIIYPIQSKSSVHT